MSCFPKFSKVFAVQQPKECFWHAFDPLKHVFFETDLPRSLPTRETLQGFASPVPPVEYQKSVDTGTCHDEMTHEPLANVRLAKLTCESNTAANHHTSTDAQIFHHCIVDGTCCVVEEDIHASGAGFLHSRRDIGGLFVVDPSIKPDFAAPFEFVIVSGNRYRTTARQFGDLADQLATAPDAAETTTVSPGRGRPNSSRPK